MQPDEPYIGAFAIDGNDSEDYEEGEEYEDYDESSNLS